jgi:RNA polymerase sigma-70 factor (ECF subfamily)
MYALAFGRAAVRRTFPPQPAIHTMERTTTQSLAGAPLSTLFEAMRSPDSRTAEEAWGECYRQFHSRVWTRVYYVVRSIHWLKEPEEVAADVMGQVFLGLPDALRNYRENGRAEYWLMRVALRTALRQRESITGKWSGGKDRRPGAHPPPGRSMVAFDDVEEIMDLVDEAERDERMELRRRLDGWKGDPSKERWLEHVELFLEGYSHDEIAERIGITSHTSRTWLWKIRRELGEPASAGRRP